MIVEWVNENHGNGLVISVFRNFVLSIRSDFNNGNTRDKREKKHRNNNQVNIF